jgi:hypothetical protein
MNDLLIIGGGISGIYAASKLGGLVLEKEDKLGGRIQFDTWRGHHVKMGGGLFRTSDTILQKLLNKYHVPYHFKYDPLFYTQQHVGVLEVFIMLRRKWIENPPKKETSFKDFALYHLGQEQYNLFLNTTLYNDYENESTESVLNDPSKFTFMISGNYGYSNLQLLIDRMSERISYQTHTEILNVTFNKHWIVHALFNGIPTTYTCRRLILATTVNTVKRIFPNSFATFIHPSPTMCIYGEFRKRDIPFLKSVIKGHTLLQFPLHQIIPIEENNGLYMIAYCDEMYAKQLIPLQEDNKANCSTLSRMIESSLHLPANSCKLVSIHSKYWDEAVHYIDRHVDLKLREKLLYKLQHPHTNLRIVGEMVSEDNGWIEAALESVKKIDWVINNDKDNENNKIRKKKKHIKKNKKKHVEKDKMYKKSTYPDTNT